jgi:hypothetical protein
MMHNINKTKWGIAAFAAAFGCKIVFLALTFTAFPIGEKAVAMTSAVVVGKVFLFAAIALLGKEAVESLKKRFSLFRKKTRQEQLAE